MPNRYLRASLALLAITASPLMARDPAPATPRPVAAPAIQEEGESSGISGYLIGAGALAAGVAAILLAGGDDGNANSP